MYLNVNFKYKNIYRTLITLFSAFGLVMCFFFRKESFTAMFAYYTVLSNLLCVIFYAIILFSKREPTSKTSAAVTSVMLLTMLMYNFMIIFSKVPTIGVKDLIVHYIVPIMVLFDYLLFVKKGTVDWKDLFTLMVLPLMYYVYLIVRASFVLPEEFAQGISRFPYEVLNYDAYGLGIFLFFTLLILVLIMLIAVCTVLLDKILYKMIKSYVNYDN